MNPRQLEIWALNVINLVKSDKYKEDDLVELKTELPEANAKIARRIAGHANTARGEDILWLIGIDEKSETNKIKGIDTDIDLANWYPSIQKHFIELAPKPSHINVLIDDKIILALGFETDRSPFVVKNQKDPNFNEVPWREGTRVRSARRSDLILLLSPIEKLPNVEILNKKAYFYSSSFAPINSELGIKEKDRIDLMIELYISPKDNTRFAIPFHRCEVSFAILDINYSQKLNQNINITPGGIYSQSLKSRYIPTTIPENITMKSSAYEIIIPDPGIATLSASTRLDNFKLENKPYDLDIEFKLYTTISDRPIILKTNLTCS